MRRELEWFSRFGDIPGVEYIPLVAVDTRKLRGSGVRPAMESGYDGERYLSWPTKDGSTSASPVHERAFASDVAAIPTGKLVWHLAETLELPGIPSDYHFAIQLVVEALWARRRSEPTVFVEVEQLSWLDLRLVQARPECVSYDVNGEQSYYGLVAFGYLITLYEREGALREAVEVAELAVRFKQQQKKRDELVGRVAALEAEAAG